MWLVRLLLVMMARGFLSFFFFFSKSYTCPLGGHGDSQVEHLKWRDIVVASFKGINRKEWMDKGVRVDESEMVRGKE